MSSFLKKFSHKYQYLKLELEEVELQSEKFNLEWNRLFGKYFVDKNSTFWINEETGEIRKDRPEEVKKKRKKTPDKLKKLFKKLSTFAHPDKGGSTEEFNLLKNAYDKEDLIELLNFAGKYDVSYNIEEEDKAVLEKVCIELEQKHKEITNSLSYVFFTGNINKKRAVISMLEQQYGFKIKEEDYPDELLDN